MKEKVLEYLKLHRGEITPTNIGMGLGKSYNTASSSVNSALKALVKEGLVIRNAFTNKVTYQYKSSDRI